jgi:ATP-binding cassette subfamily F protein uup
LHRRDIAEACARSQPLASRAAFCFLSRGRRDPNDETMPAPPLLLLQEIEVTLGSLKLLERASLSVAPGDRIALVGRNGSGKSTLLKIAAAMIAPDKGTRFLQPGATLRYLPQEPDLSGFATALAYVESGLGPSDDPYRARYLLERLGLTGEEDPAHLSGGEARRAALARCLAPQPDILLLDEPTNHLDLPAISWLEEELKNSRSALVLISHDRRFLENLSRAMVWLDRGVTRRLEQSFASFENWRDQVFEEEETQAHKLGRQIAREEDWLRYGVTARRKRNVRRLGNLIELRKKRRERIGPQGAAKLAAAAADVSGTLVIAAEGVSKRYGETVIVRDFSTRILRGDRIGIVGPNGAGKTTLLNLLTGSLASDEGVVTRGTNLEMVTLDQRRESLDDTRTLAETLTQGAGDTVFVGDSPRHVLGYMKDFLFTPEQARTPVGVLSGGERGRLMLARALAAKSNLLVLDEPTNDLDLETLDLLQELLGDYAGTALVVSHDRDFLDRVCTSVIVSEGDGAWREYAGGYSDMLAQRGKGVEAKEIATPPPPSASGSSPARHASSGPKRKLSFKEKHALETLPKEIEALQRMIENHRAAIADPALYRRDRAAFETASAALAAAEVKRAAAEEEWLRLELLREEIETAGVGGSL